MKHALAGEIEKSKSLELNYDHLSSEHSKLFEENKIKEERIVKLYHDYMETYETLLKVRNQKAEDLAKKKDKKKPKNVPKNKGGEIFEDLFDKADPRGPRMSVRQPGTNDSKLPYSHFNMSGGRSDSTEESEHKSVIKDLEDENKRLLGLIEYKEYELNKMKKEEDLNITKRVILEYHDLQTKSGQNLGQLEATIREKDAELVLKNKEIDDLKSKLVAKNEEIKQVEERWSQRFDDITEDYEKKMKLLHAKLGEASKEVIEGYKEEIQKLMFQMAESEKVKSRLLDEKLKIEEIIDKQVEQIDYWSNKANK